MPGMDGLEVAEKIRERCPWTPVVVITGFGNEENEARASVLGVSGFVHKPLTPEMIESITLKALETPMEATEVVPEAANDEEAPARKTVKELKGWRKVLRIVTNIGLFFAAPFIALSYIIALPIVGFYTFVKFAVEAWQKRGTVS
jgi:CheY-like chemotaxis protein